MNHAAVDALTDIVLHALGRGEPITPDALTLLVRQYQATGRDDVRHALERTLAQGLDIATTDVERPRRAEWLLLLVEAGRLSEDERVQAVCGALAAGLQRDWPHERAVGSAMRSIEACLAFGMIPHAIDELERLVGLVYVPGSGVAHSASDPRGPRGGLDDHVSAASALLAAFSATGRLPYAMLAEELVQFALRTQHPAPSTQHPSLSTQHPAPFVISCQLARVLCQLAALHDDADYRAAAVLADHDYAADAEQTLASLADDCRQEGLRGAIYGVVVLEWFAIHHP